MSECIRNDTTYLVNKKVFGGNTFHTNDILEFVQQSTSIVDFFVEKYCDWNYEGGK